MAKILALHGMTVTTRLLLAALVAVLVFLFPLAPWHALELRLVAGWVAGAVCFLVLSFCAMHEVSPAQLRQRARALDGRGGTALVLIVLAAISSLAALAFMMHQKDEVEGAALAWRLGLGGLGMVCAWTLIHVIFAMHYAHLYYGDAKNTAAPDDMVGGLEFAGSEKVGYGDFLYFSFVIGMTCQTSDVEITGRAMRRLVLVHSILAFFFNTAVLALSINMVAGRL